jgi:hypothetical protein
MKLGKQLIHVWIQLSFQTEGIRIYKPGLLIRIAFNPDTDTDRNGSQIYINPDPQSN